MCLYLKIDSFLKSLSRIESKYLFKLIYKWYKIVINIFFFFFKEKEFGCDPGSDYKIIVSLTTFPSRIGKIYPNLLTLFRQNLKPNKIILWLSEEQFPNGFNDVPEKIKNLKNNGLEIKFCEDLKSHKKYFESLKIFHNYTVITVDDDVFYPESLVYDLYELHKKFPGCVCCTWAHNISLNSKGEIDSYDNWEKGVEGSLVPNLYLCAIGCGGILYPPNCFKSNEIFNKQNIKKYCLTSDDIWLKVMEVRENIPVIRVRNKAIQYFTNIWCKKSGLFNLNLNKNKNDETLANLIEQYSDMKDLYNENKI